VRPTRIPAKSHLHCFSLFCFFTIVSQAGRLPLYYEAKLAFLIFLISPTFRVSAAPWSFSSDLTHARVRTPSSGELCTRFYSSMRGKSTDLSPAPLRCVSSAVVPHVCLFSVRLSVCLSRPSDSYPVQRARTKFNAVLGQVVNQFRGQIVNALQVCPSQLWFCVSLRSPGLQCVSYEQHTPPPHSSDH
jgi:hypothetical protein